MKTEKAPAGEKISLDFTPSELWDEVAKPSLDERMNTSSEAPSNWNGNITYQEAQRLARDGWPDGLKKIAPTLARVDDLVAHVLKEKVLVYDVVGDCPDVGAYLSGIPECMLAQDEQDGAAKVVRVIVNIGASFGVSAKTLEARGIVACALVDALERVGYRCEVVVKLALSSGGNEELISSVFKTAQEPLNLDRIAFALIHPAFFRRLLFRVLERMGGDGETGKKFRTPFSYGYGRPMPVQGEKGDIVITEMYGSGSEWTPEILAKEVLRYLKEVGVTMDPVTA